MIALADAPTAENQLTATVAAGEVPSLGDENPSVKRRERL